MRRESLAPATDRPRHVIDPAADTDLAAAGPGNHFPHGVDYAFDTTGRPEILTVR